MPPSPKTKKLRPDNPWFHQGRIIVDYEDEANTIAAIVNTLFPPRSSDQPKSRWSEGPRCKPAYVPFSGWNLDIPQVRSDEEGEIWDQINVLLSAEGLADLKQSEILRTFFADRLP